jgi:hypothetical protein
MERRMTKIALMPAEMASKYPDADVLMPKPDGALDLGEISQEAAAAANIAAGPIRLPYGIPEHWGFGLQHVQAKQDRVRAIQKLGFVSVQVFICDVASNWTHIVEGRDRKPLLIWQKGGYDLTIVVTWKDTYWSVTTALPYRVAQGTLLYKREEK